MPPRPRVHRWVRRDVETKAGPKARRSDLKRQKILDAAAAVFRRRGYAQATLGEIADEAHTQAGSLYYYFENREQLVEEVLAYAHTRLVDRVTAAVHGLDEEIGPMDRLIVAIRTHVQTVLDRNDYVLAFERIYDQVPDEMRERIVQVPRTYGRFWHGLIQAAQEAGAIRPELDARLLRLLLIGSMSWMADWYKPDGASKPEEIADTLLSMFLEGAAVDRRAAGRRIARPELQMRPDPGLPG
jgi:TetR/AcrR family transcriptional regulator, cholesterol catabolism regulator